MIFFLTLMIIFNHSKKNESCVTQDKTVYQAKAKFILVRIEQFEINTVYCVELFLNGTK